MRRRDLLLSLAAVPALSKAPGLRAQQAAARLRGRIRQGARGTSLDDACREASRLGIVAFDLIGPNDWPTLRKYGIVPSMYPLGPGGTIADALNRKENHARIAQSLRTAIDEAARANVPNIITFSGNRRGMADAEGADNCVAFLNGIKAHAEDKGVTICMELLNSKVNRS
jgi:hydroxypyruvate isomerase